MVKLKTEPDKQVIGYQHMKHTSVTSVNLLNCGKVTDHTNTDIPFKSKSVNPGIVSNLQIFSQNVKRLGNKIDELIINLVNEALHILCLLKHHLSTEIIQTTIIENYNLGASYCRNYIKCGSACIFIHKSYQ
jgi:hypothetical protein